MTFPLSTRRLETFVGPALGVLGGGGIGLLAQRSEKGAVLAVASGLALSIGSAVFIMRRCKASRSAAFVSLLAIAAIAVWGGLQLVHSSSLLSDDTRAWSYKFKNYWGAGVVCGLLAWMSSRIATKKLVVTSSQLQLLGCGLLFPVYCALSLAARGYFNPPLVSMYFLWALYAFWEVPILLQQETKRLLFCKIVMGALLLLTGYGIVVGICTGNLYWTWTSRMSFVFHVVAYGHVLSVLSALALVCLVETGRKKTCLFVYAAMFVLAILAVTRNTLVFLVVAAASFFFGQRGKKKEALIAFCMLLLVSLLFLQNWGVEEDDIDKLSSGRLSLFSSEFANHLPTDRLSWWLFGSETFLGAERTLVLDAVGVDARFERNVTDNSYLSIILGHGLVGLLLFLVPFVFIYSRLLAVLRQGQLQAKEKLRVHLALAVLEGLAAQSLFMITIPSMGNLVSIVLPTLWRLSDETQRAARSTNFFPVRPPVIFSGETIPKSQMEI